MDFVHPQYLYVRVALRGVEMRVIRGPFVASQVFLTCLMERSASLQDNLLFDSTTFQRAKEF